LQRCNDFRKLFEVNTKHQKWNQKYITWASRFKISPNVTMQLRVKTQVNKVRKSQRSKWNNGFKLLLSRSLYDARQFPREIYWEREREKERKKEREESYSFARLSYDRIARDDPISLTREQILRTLSTQRLFSGPRPGTWVSGSEATMHVCMSCAWYTRTSARTHTQHMHSRRADTGSHVRTNKEARPTSRPSVRPSVRPRGGVPRTLAQLILRHWFAIGGRSSKKNGGESIAGRMSEKEEQKKKEKERNTEKKREPVRQKGERKVERKAEHPDPWRRMNMHICSIRQATVGQRVHNWVRAHASTRMACENVSVCTYKPK